MNYEEAVAYIEDTPRFTTKNSLEHTKDCLRRLGDPQKIPVKKTVQTTSKWHRKDTPIQKMSDKILRLGLDIFHHYYIMVS